MAPRPTPVSRLRNAALFLCLAVAWGGSFPAIEVGLTAFEPIGFAAARYALAAVLLLGYAWLVADDPRPRTRDDAVAVVAGGLLLVAANSVFLFYGQQLTTGGAAAIVYSLNPIATAALAAVLIGTRSLSGVGYVGVGLGLVGVALVADPDLASLAAGRDGRGVALVAVAVLSVSLGSVLVERADAQASVATVTAWATVVGALVLVGGALVLGQSPAVGAPADALAALGFLTVVSSAAGYVIYFDLLARLGPFQINLVSYAVPVVATVVGWALLGERIGPSALAGFALVLVGFLLVRRRDVRAALGRDPRPAE